MEKIKIGQEFLQLFNAQGYQAYLVGGTVRDFLLGHAIKDLDVTTSATPKQVVTLFPDAIPTGIKYGTVTVKFKGQYIEVTTFRSESDYLDYRRPSVVKYSESLEEDLSRRDFTINALAMDADGGIFDYHEGRKALTNRIICTMGVPQERFREDPLRMLRAIRFIAQLGFQIEENSWTELKNSAPFLRHVAVERVKMEMDRILDSPYVEEGIEMLFASGLLEWLPRIALTELGTLDGKQLSRLIGQSENIITRWYLLLHLLNADNFTFLLGSLSFSQKERKGIEERAAVYQLLSKDLTTQTLTKCLISYEKESIAEAIKILLGGDQESAVFWLEQLEMIDQQLTVRSVKDLAIDGNQLLSKLKLRPGVMVGKILDELLQRVIFQGLANKKSTLLAEAARIRGELSE
jgi:tRNA nucleotidyltransferase (CCA-adding enzyme)